MKGPETLRNYLLRLTGLGFAGLVVVLVVAVVLVLLLIVPEGTYIGAISQDGNGQPILPTSEVFARRFASEGQFVFLIITCFLLGLATELRGFNDEKAFFWCKAVGVLVALFVAAGCVVAYLHFGGVGVKSVLGHLWNAARYVGIVIFCGAFAWWFGSEMGGQRRVDK